MRVIAHGRRHVTSVFAILDFVDKFVRNLVIENKRC